MAINYHAAQDDFGSIVHRLQPMVLTNFVMWLDMKVAEFKVYGQMLLENENREIPNWYLRPNFDSETLVSMAKQKIQVPVSLVPKKVINKQTVHVPILPSHRNRSTRSQSATKLKNDTDKVIDSLEPTIVKHPRLHHAQGIDMLQEETDSSALTFVSKEYSQSDSPLYSTTRLEVSECEKRHMPSEETLNTSVEALDTSVEAIDSSQADSQCTARVVPKAEPVDEEFEVIENRLQTSTLSDTVDMLEHNIPLHDASVSSAIKTPLSTEKVAKTLVQSDGTMFLMPQTDKDATDTSVVLPACLSKLNFTSLSGAVNHGNYGNYGGGEPVKRKHLKPKREVSNFYQQDNSQMAISFSSNDVYGCETGLDCKSLELQTNKRVDFPLAFDHKNEDKSDSANDTFNSSYNSSDVSSWKDDYVDLTGNIPPSFEERKMLKDETIEFLPHSSVNESDEFATMDNADYTEADLENAMVITSPEGELLYACWMCERSFRLRSGLKRHVESHFARRTVNCDICGQTFTNKHNLKSHQRMHDDKTFQCLLCSYRTCRKSDLKKHLQRMHGFDHAKSSKLCDL